MAVESAPLESPLAPLVRSPACAQAPSTPSRSGGNRREAERLRAQRRPKKPERSVSKRLPNPPPRRSPPKRPARSPSHDVRQRPETVGGNVSVARGPKPSLSAPAP